MFNKLPEELKGTFEKMIQQLDIIAKTMKIMDQRIATVENQVVEIYQSRKRRTTEEDNQNINIDNNNENNNTYKPQSQYNDSYNYNKLAQENNKNDFKMSQKYEQQELQTDEFYGYNDSFKVKNQGSNVFNNNLGLYNSNGDEEYMKEKEEGLNALEIFEDVNNHIEELNDENNYMEMEGDNYDNAQEEQNNQ